MLGLYEHTLNWVIIKVGWVNLGWGILGFLDFWVKKGERVKGARVFLKRYLLLLFDRVWVGVERVYVGYG